MDLSERFPLVCFEDEHLLVINKPAGVNTHSPSPFAGEGIYDWLRHREPRWADLAIIHRLDKETSGVLVFSKSSAANRSLTEQFAQRQVRKKYLFVTEAEVSNSEIKAVSAIVRAGEKYLSRPLHRGGDRAETHFHLLGSHPLGALVEAEPVTGRTHQIRVHAADQGFPVLGDTLYGGTTFQRLCLHSAEVCLTHPVTGLSMCFQAQADFCADARLGLRTAVIDPHLTNAYRCIHGASDCWPGWYADRLGNYFLSQSERPLSTAQRSVLSEWLIRTGARGAYHKMLTRTIGRSSTEENSPVHVLGQTAPKSFEVTENGVHYELSFGEGYSLGIFLDQRDNRRRLLTNHIAAGFPLFDQTVQPKEVLNAFSYTCGFSVCAALAGQG